MAKRVGESRPRIPLLHACSLASMLFESSWADADRVTKQQPIPRGASRGAALCAASPVLRSSLLGSVGLPEGAAASRAPRSSSSLLLAERSSSEMQTGLLLERSTASAPPAACSLAIQARA